LKNTARIFLCHVDPAFSKPFKPQHPKYATLEKAKNIQTKTLHLGKTRDLLTRIFFCFSKFRGTVSSCQKQLYQTDWFTHSKPQGTTNSSPLAFLKQVFTFHPVTSVINPVTALS